MAGNLATKVRDEKEFLELRVLSPGKINHEAPKKETSAPAIEKKPSHKQLSKFSIALISTAFCMLAAETAIYFHSVHVEIHANKLQKDIVDIKENNYMLNVELEKTKELSKVEKFATENLKMQASLNSEVKYLILPEVKMENFVEQAVNIKTKSLSVPSGY